LKFYLIRADAELEFVVSTRLYDDWVAGVQLINVQVAGILLVLCNVEKEKNNFFSISFVSINTQGKQVQYKLFINKTFKDNKVVKNRFL
jgi:hypothetical protein